MRVVRVVEHRIGESREDDGAQDHLSLLARSRVRTVRLLEPVVQLLPLITGCAFIQDPNQDPNSRRTNHQPNGGGDQDSLQALNHPGQIDT